MHPVWKVLIVLAVCVTTMSIALVIAGDTLSALSVVGFGFSAILFVLVVAVFFGVGDEED